MAALKPKLAAMMMRPGGDQPQSDVFVIAVKADDPNGDDLVYDIYFREVGRERWVQLEKDFKEAMKTWDPHTVSDGTYEVKVVAKDTPDNPPSEARRYARISDPVVVDTTPPVIQIERAEADGRKIHVRASIRDALSSVTEAEYAVNSNDDWVALAAVDDIFDSPSETVEFTIDDAETGENRLAIRASDDAGNTPYATVAVTVGP